MENLNKNIKQLREDIMDYVVDKSVDLTLAGAGKVKDKVIDSITKKRNYTEMKLSIQDIINDALWRYKANHNKCNNTQDDETYFICKKNVTIMQIKQLQKSVSQCSKNSDPILCRTRVLEEIIEKKNFILKCEQKINDLKEDDIKLYNARHVGNTYWGNEYKSLDD